MPRLLPALCSLAVLLTLAACGGTERRPADILNLTNWKLTLPIAVDDDEAWEVKQPCLAQACFDPDKEQYDNEQFKKPFADQFFHVSDDGKGVVFKAPVEGATTSGSMNTRTELRELFPASTKGKENEASWSNRGSAVHTLELEAAITSTPKKYPSLAVAQIHDDKDDVVLIKLRGHRLFADGNDGKFTRDLTRNYELGTKFTLEITATEGVIRITYNDSKTVVYKHSGKDMYFKAGCYNQSNLEKFKDEDPDSYGETILYDLKVTHTP